MSTAASARRLRDHIASLQTMTRFVLATLALASGVYTYLGVRSLLDGDAGLVFFAAIVYSAAVSVGIYGFWIYMIRFLPEMRDWVARVTLMGIMCVGSLMIVAMSSWLNAAALAGSAAIEQHLAHTQEGYTADLDQAHSNALAALSLLPDIQRAAERFARLAEEERSSGALTGASGTGSVVQLLSQMSAQMRELEATIQGNRETVRDLFVEGQAHLGRHLGQQLHDGAGARGAGQCTGVAFLFGQAREPLRRPLDVGQQRQRSERIGMGLIEIGRVAFLRIGQMLLDRRRTGKRGRIQPGRHGNDHQRADAHDDEQRHPCQRVPHLRHEADHVGPEAVYADRDCGRIDDRREEDEAGIAVEQAAHAEIGVNAACQCQRRQHEARHGLQ
jgi:hypothetical protein